MSVKSILKKKLKIKNSILSLKKKKPKKKQENSELSVDSYLKIDPDNINKEHSTPEKIQNKITISTTNVSFKCENNHEMNIDKTDFKKTTKIRKKRSISDTDLNNDSDLPRKKRVTFAPDVKSEKDDQKSSMFNLKPLSLNKRKKLNYIKKLKAKKNKKKNAKKHEENLTAASTPRQERAFEYLMQWKNDRSNWKFKKIYQLWLVKNIYDPTKISKEYFEVLVEYLQTIEGKSRSLILQNANTIISELSSSNEQEELNSSQKSKYQRARAIIQTLD